MKPEYKFLDNFRYAREGFLAVFKSEKSFRIEIFFFVLLSIVAIFLPVSLFKKIILISSMMLPLVVELVNSAIERIVDVMYKDYNENAKYIKDSAAAAVMISLFVPTSIWIGVLMSLLGY